MGNTASMDVSRPTHPSMAHHRMSMNNAQRPTSLDLHGINNMTQAGMPQQDGFDLSRVDTHTSHTSHLDFGEPLTHIHTAPAYTGMQPSDLDQLFTPGGNTVNPAQLHFAASTASQPVNLQNFHMNQFDLFGQGDDFAWMREWEPQLQAHAHVDAVDQSSPSRFSSTASQSGYSETVTDAPFNTSQAWNSSDMQALMTPGALNLDILGTGLPNIDPPLNTVSPHNLHDPNAPTSDSKLDALMMHSGIPESLSNMHFGQFQPSSLSTFDSDSPSISSSSVPDSARQSSVTSISTDSITDATRQALLLSLSQPSAFSHRKFSQPSISSPLSPRPQGPSLPSTADLQRYINAYIQYFHPHLPFLHIPTLSFDSPEYMTNLRNAGTQASANHSGVVGGGGCLILAMAAIGALNEYDHQASKELFDSAKKMIQLYLEERRKVDMSAAVNSQYFHTESSTHNTPLWLVQAMLLNVIYGHYCGDKTAADIASNHCAALVSLARAAELAQPCADHDFGDMKEENPDVHMEDGSSPMHGHTSLHLQWLKWKEAEERKRTLFAIFILSSLLVVAYNQTPAITNSEILLALPCDEELWTADSAREWAARGGAQAAEASATPFASALSTLLTANQRQQHSMYGFNRYSPSGDSHGASPQLRPSTFGCLVLINALHNYIWETRSRHIGRQWTTQETEAMVAHIEPALNAWQAAWKANDRHKLQRPNPFGLGPLAADSIPLLDLAFVRLFVNLGRSKEAFWQRDFQAMSEELACGVDIAQTGSPEHSSGNSSADSPSGFMQNSFVHNQTQSSGHSSKRERHLRKAAFYAADSLVISSKCNLTFADSSAHELPIQSAMCFLDCAQVLAEWETTVQERIGRYVGVLGQSDVDYGQVPAVMLLDTEDVELLNKMESICTAMEEKMAVQAKMLAHEMGTFDPNGTMGLPSPLERLSGLSKCGLGSRILRMTAQMLEKAAVWPGKQYRQKHDKKSNMLTNVTVTHVMASALEMQAVHVDQRAENSVTAMS